MSHDFIPCTIPRHIGDGVFFRPIKSWHSGTFAGEGLTKIPNTEDGSGCILPSSSIQRVCYPPHTVTHRIYWRGQNISRTISAFLSYPNSMGACDEYFWEAYPIKGDCERFVGPNAEIDMEKVIKEALLNPIEEKVDASL